MRPKLAIHRSFSMLPAILFAALLTPTLRAAEPATTVLADFEDLSVAARLAETRNVPPAACRLRPATIPARGQHAIVLDISATKPNATVVLDLRFRTPTVFANIDRINSYIWIKDHSARVAFRVLDQNGQAFETPEQSVTALNQWALVSASADKQALRPVINGFVPPEPLTYEQQQIKPKFPLEVAGLRITLPAVARQQVYIDDVHVEHEVPPHGLIRGSFSFDQPTKIYPPGARVGVAVVLENTSHSKPANVLVELRWRRPDGVELDTQRARATMQASGRDYRAHHRIDFSQVVDVPGLYELVATVRGIGWQRDYEFETTVAVAPLNRNVLHGRSPFFAVRSNLLREPRADQQLEIALAREIGARVLMIDLPWKQLEPEPERIEFDFLDEVVREIEDQNLLPALRLTDPPAWAAENRTEKLRLILEALVAHFGPDVAYLAVAPELLPIDDERRREWLEKTAAALTEIRAEVTLIADPIRLDQAPDDVGPTTVDQEWQQPYLTSGDSARAAAALAGFAGEGRLDWNAKTRWHHHAEPIIGPGTDYQAVAMLEFHLAAARAGVAGVTWFDLRDDAVDPDAPNLHRGLVRRDFSPKTSLLGYMSAVGMLAGLKYDGPVPGAPEAFDSALFIGSDRQVGVLVPRADRPRPALIAPIQGVPGELAVFDFDRRPIETMSTAGGILAPTLAQPIFVELRPESAQPEPQLALGKPWIRVPATVLAGAGAQTRIEIDALTDLRRSFLALNLPDTAPLRSNLTATAVRAAAGETFTEILEITPTVAGGFPPIPASLRFSYEQRDSVRVPFEVAPLLLVRPRERNEELIQEKFRLGELRVLDQRRASATGEVYGAYDDRRFYLAVVLTDGEWLLPEDNASARVDQLFIGFQAPDTGRIVFQAEDLGTERPDLRPTFGTPETADRGFRMSGEDTADQTRVFEIQASARALDQRTLTPGWQFRAALRFVDYDRINPVPSELQWGAGLDGSRDTTGYIRLQLSED